LPCYKEPRNAGFKGLSFNAYIATALNLTRGNKFKLLRWLCVPGSTKPQT